MIRHEDIQILAGKEKEKKKKHYKNLQVSLLRKLLKIKHFAIDDFCSKYLKRKGY